MRQEKEVNENNREVSVAWELFGTHAKEGDLAELVGNGYKHFIIQLTTGAEFQSHRGIVKHDDIIGKQWGSILVTHKGSKFFLLQPALADLLRGIPRNTQILYPKDIGFILVTMGIGPGVHVLEAGTGSGALTCAFAYAVGATGKVTTYEARSDFQQLAIRNLERIGLRERVTSKLRNVQEGFDEENVDALFLDVPNPFDYMAQVRKALKPGGFFGCILPTVNQVTSQLISLRREGFAFIEVCELLLRYYKPEPSRLRPSDRMVAHTGFLIFARLIFKDKPSETMPNLEEWEKDDREEA
jgi:tRNA (adenine57-N1/adenine58-N1)-methyltransferase